MQAARIIAQLLVMGSGMLVRAFAQAYRQALASTFPSLHKFLMFFRYVGRVWHFKLGLILE